MEDKFMEKTRGAESSVKYYTKKQSNSLRTRGNQGKLALCVTFSVHSLSCNIALFPLFNLIDDCFFIFLFGLSEKNRDVLPASIT